MTTRRPVSRHTWSRLLAAIAAVGIAGVVAAPALAHADGPLTVSTPYPTIETQPGSTVKLDVNVASTSTSAVDLAVAGVPDGWKTTMRGGGFVVGAVTSTSLRTPHRAATR